MTRKITKIAYAALVVVASLSMVPAAEAKRDIYIKKKTLKSAVPASFSKGGYTMKCAKWGDCGNYNITF